MTFLPHSGLLSYKYLNAKIKDSGGKIKIVHIVNYIGDYFVTTINHKPYVFKVDSKEIGIIDEFGIKKYRIIDYSTKHYKPISDKTDAIKQLIENDKLPRINLPLFNVLKNLGKREKADFKKHDVQKLLDELIEAKNSKIAKILGRDSKYQEAAINVIDFLESLSTKEIVTPTREIAEYIEDDLITTDPGFFGTVITTQQRTDVEHKKITNTPVGPKKPFGILLAIIFGIGLIIAGVYILYDIGAFDNIGASLGGSFGGPNDEQIMSKYPSCASLKSAVSGGSLDYNSLSAKVKAIFDSCPT
jgi:hypothetical protein